MSVIRWLVVQEVCIRFEFPHHFESHLTWPPPFIYMHMRTTISDEHSIVTMLLSTPIIFSTYSFKPRLQWLQLFRLHIYGISKWLTQLTHAHTATARVSPHVHSTYTSYVLYAYLLLRLCANRRAISIRDQYNIYIIIICAVHESVPTNRTLSSTGRCLCIENVAIGFKTSIETYFVEKTALRRRSCSM